MATYIQPSFTKGEIGPSLYGRVDTAAYQVALRTARNAIVHPYGGISSRPGSQFIGPVKDHAEPPRLIGFQFKTTDSYILEFGDKYMRVIRNDAHVTDTPKSITAITKANPAVVTVTAHGYSNGDEVFLSSVTGMPLLEQQRFIIANVTTNTFSLKYQVTGAAVDSSSFPTFVAGTAMAARIYTLATPYVQADLPLLKSVQSADVMTLTHNLYPVYELSRTDHNAWTLTQLQTGPSITFPTGELITPVTTGTSSYQYQVTALRTGTLEESLPGIAATKAITAITKANPAVITATGHGFANGDVVYISGVVGMVEINGQRSAIAGVAANTFTMVGIDSTSYTAYASGGTAGNTYAKTATGNVTAKNTIAWDAVADASSYNVYKFDNGSFGIIGTTNATTFLDDNIGADLSVSPPQSENPFDGPGNYPGTCSYYEQRRVFGGTVNRPDTSFYSQIGNPSNFNVSSPTQDNDAITATLNARQVNEIRNFVPGNDLLVFTSGSEWKVNSGPDTQFSATSIRQKPQSDWGSSNLEPLTAGTTVIFLEDNRQRVRTFSYSFQLDGYTGNNMALLAPHLLDQNFLNDWTFASSPDPRMYGVRDDGQLLTMTFDEEQDVIGWTHWDTLGKYEAVESIKNPSLVPGFEDGVYFVVRRIINGNIVRYIEKLASGRFADVRDCFFVDCGLSFDNPVSITGISLTDPIVITAPAHGFANGDMIDLSDIEWVTSVNDNGDTVIPQQLNLIRYTISNVTTNTFEIDVDGTDFAPYVEGGYARKSVQTISGLQHIANSDVAVLADGNVVSGLHVDANGSMTMPRHFSRVQIGLPYVADIETLNVEAPQGTIQGKLKKISTVTVRFEKSRGMFAGPTSDELIEMKQREYENMGDPTLLLTGDHYITLLPSWNSNGRIFIRQKYPLPMTILAIMPDIEVQD